MKDYEFHVKCISNEKRLFCEKVSQKIHGQVCLDIKVYQDTNIFLFTETPPEITTDNHIGKKISFQP